MPPEPVAANQPITLPVGPTLAGPALCVRSHIALPADCPWVRNVWCDFDSQLQHADCCRTPAERELLQVANEKMVAAPGSCYGNYWRNQRRWQGYDATASIIACSNYAKCEDLIRCGYASFQCQDRLFCPRCCYRRLAQPLVGEFGDAFSAASEVWFVVLSLSADPDEKRRLVFQDLDASAIHSGKFQGVGQPCTREDYGLEFQVTGDLLPCRLIWLFMDEAIREFTGNGRGQFFHGVVGGPELSVQFGPLRVLPHANYLVWTSGFSIDETRALRKRLRTKMRDCRQLKIGLYPSLSCYRLTSPDDLRRVAQYMCKPINLATAYQTAADLVDLEPAQMAELNTETNAFLTNLSLVFHYLRRITRSGCCSANHHAYVGKVTPRRMAQRERDAERRSEQGGVRTAGQKGASPRNARKSPIERWEQRIEDQLNRPAWWRPSGSRFQHWLIAMLPPPPLSHNST